jgi:hypothetical protein
MTNKKLVRLKGFTLMRRVILKSLLIFLLTSAAVSESSSAKIEVSDFDIRGIKLGMLPEDVKKIEPNFIFSENPDYKKYNSPYKYRGGAGTGWNMIADYTISVKFAGGENHMVQEFLR